MPAAVSFTLVVVVLIIYLNPLRITLLPINTITRGVRTKVTMEQPRLSDLREMGASRADGRYRGASMTKPDIVELRNIRAKIKCKTGARWSPMRQPDSMTRKRNAKARSGHRS